MPRKITYDMTLEDVEDEIIFTRSALKADADASDFLPETDDWLGFLDAAKAKERASREAVGSASALRAVANARLDAACRAFGDALFLAEKKDAQSARFRRFFKIPISRFMSIGLAKQVAEVQSGWLSVTGDSLLEEHRAALETTAKAAAEALEQTHMSAQVRGAAQIAREELAESLTRERDGLEALLRQRAQERNLERDWPSIFFRTGHGRGRGASESGA